MSTIKELPTLKELKAGMEWCTQHADGSLSIKDATFERPNGKLKLTVAIRVAFALNQACKKRRRGRVYTYVPAEIGQNDKKRMDAQAALRAASELFYVDGPWTDEDVAVWDSTTPFKLMHHLTGRHGHVSLNTPVLEFAAEIHDSLRKSVSFDGLSQAPVLLLLSPWPHVGLQKEMRRECGRSFMSSGNDIPTGSIFLGKEKGWAEFEQWKVDGIDGVIDRFEEMYAGQGPPHDSYLVFFSDLVARFIAGGDQAAKFGQPYGLSGPNSNWDN